MFRKIYLCLSYLAAAAALIFLDGWWKLAALPILCLMPAVFTVLHFVFLFIVSLFIDTKKPPKKWNSFIWSLIISTIPVVEMFFRIKLKVEGEELLPKDRRFLLVCNHRSMLDPVLTVGAFPDRHIAFISKPEVMKIPCIAPLIHSCYFTAIDRENPRNAINCINYNAQLLRDDVCSVGVYPEGTRSKDGKLLPFHDGVFKIAQKASVPVAVATVEGTELIKKHFPWRPIPVQLRIHKLIPNAPEEKLRSHQLAADARAVILSALGEDA